MVEVHRISLTLVYTGPVVLAMEAVKPTNVSALWIHQNRYRRDERCSNIFSWNVPEDRPVAQLNLINTGPQGALVGRLRKVSILFLSLIFHAVGCLCQGTSKVETVCSDATGCTERLIIELDVVNLDVRAHEQLSRGSHIWRIHCTCRCIL